MLGTKVSQTGVLGAYLFIIFTFTCQHDQLVGVCSGRLKGGGGLRCGHSSKKGGLRYESNSKKRGVLGAGQVRTGGLYRDTYLF